MGVEIRLKMAFVVNSVLAYGVDPVLEKEFASFALQVMKIHPLNQTFSMILQTFSPTLHNLSMRHTRASYVKMILTTVIIVHYGPRLSMSRNRAAIKTLVIIIIYKIRRVFHNNIFAVKTVGDLMEIFNTSIYHQHPKEMSVQELLLQEKLHKALQAICEKLLQQKHASNIDQTPLQELTRLTPTYDMLAIPWNTIGGFDVEGNQGLKLIYQELVMIQGPGLKIVERLKGLESSSHRYKHRNDHTVKIHLV
nr:hypothetical protein [Tanacetum cinerariifolium]